MKNGMWLVLALGVVSTLGGCSGSSRGTVSLSWVITENGQDVQCNTGENVEVLARRSSKDTVNIYDCTDMGASFDLPPGNYTLFVYLRDDNDVRITTSSGANITVVKDQTTAIGTVEFVFETSGAAAFRVHMGSASVTGGNCNSTQSNGAGVAQEEIRVTSATQCMSFDITGVTNENDVPITTQTCAKFVCQESTTVHTIGGLPDGQYTVQVLGYKGATGSSTPLCYISNQMSFTISGGNTAQVGQIFAPFDDSMDTAHLCNATKPSEA